MNGLVIQQASGSCVPLLRMSEQRHRQWACQHGMDYLAVYADQDPAPFGMTSQKQVLLRRVLWLQPENFLLVSLDADMLVVKPEHSPMEALEHNDLALLGAEHFVNGGLMVMRNSRYLRDLIEAVYQKGPVSKRDNQIDTRLHLEIKERDWKGVKILDDRWNHFKKIGSFQRPVSHPESEAIILAWHGPDKEYAAREMVRHLEQVPEPVLA